MNIPRLDLLKEELSNIGFVYLIVIGLLVLFVLFLMFVGVEGRPDSSSPIGPASY